MSMTVVGIGPDDASLLTLQAMRTLENAKKIILKTEKHGVADWLKERKIPFETLDALYDEADDFDDFNRKAAELIASREDVCLGVPDVSTDEVVALLCRQGIPMQVLCGVSQADMAAAEALADGYVAEAGMNVLPASAFEEENCTFDPRRALVITELNSRLQAGTVKLALLELYPPEAKIVFCGKEIELENLDRQEEYNHLSRVFVPASSLKERSRNTVDDLLEIMKILRTPMEGCPWDLEQTHETLAQYLIEEAYEVLDTIRQDDPLRMADELGDVLLQVVFHARIGWEYGEFTMTDIVSNICQKMISRHPHIFGTEKKLSVDEVNENWEIIKKREKALKTTADMMEDIPRTLPTLMRANKVGHKARQVGMDETSERWIERLETLLAQKNRDAGWAGKALWALTGAVRRMELQPELVMDAEIERIIADFTKMEKECRERKKPMESLPEAELSLLKKELYDGDGKRV